MKTILKAIICTVIIAISAFSSNAKTIHAIAFCNTNDVKIGQAAVVSHDMFNNELSTLAYYLNYDYVFEDFVGSDCSKENLEKKISSITSKPEDIIVFYYFGHGTRSKDQTSPFPQMCLKYEIYNQDKFMPVQYVINRLKNQQAHLKLIVSMCCNNVVGGVSPKNNMCDAMGPTTMDQTNVENLKKIFNDFSGVLAITGSKPGQYSWCNARIGGFFDVEFWNAINAVGNNELSADWKSICNTIQQKTDKVVYGCTNPPTHQVPYFEIYEGGIKPDADTKDKGYNPDKRIEGPKTSDDLQNAISKMIGTTDTNRRIEMVDDIISSFFSGDNSVIVQLYGRNMQTIIDTMDIETYLRSVALSSNILRVKNIGTDRINNRSVIKLHEIRK
jgi:hypothetical protein